MRLSAPGRWPRPSSAPVNVRRAIAAEAPRLSSVAVSCCDCNTRTEARNNRLGNGDVVTDRDVGRERRDDGAVLLERQIDRAPDLDVVGSLPADGEMKRNRGVAARLRRAARAAHGDLEGLELDALLLQNDDDIRRRAGCGGEEQQLDRRCGGLRIAVHENRRTPPPPLPAPRDAAPFALPLPQPTPPHPGGPRHARWPASA